GAAAGATKVWRDARGRLRGAEPVHEQRQVRAMLLDGAEREEDDAAPVTRETRGFAKRQLGELEHDARDAITDVSPAGVSRRARDVTERVKTSGPAGERSRARGY